MTYAAQQNRSDSFLAPNAAGQRSQRRSQQNYSQRQGQSDEFDGDEFIAATFWLNFGMMSGVDEDGEPMFVSLSRGVPLDRIKKVTGNGSLSKAKRGLHETLMAVASSLEPGEGRILVKQGVFAVQVRRVADGDEPMTAADPHAAALDALRQQFGL